ncbi:unnamed protein product [Effrenium voratum]|uniref:Methyltransferase FkbM domain-containing protein n=1 Tax=Effrenium voratum TaxID=2562239 RepID=A0AA36JRG9_9DINO|nr:unnamed protein product [Effrenium voratum]
MALSSLGLASHEASRLLPLSQQLPTPGLAVPEPRPGSGGREVAFVRRVPGLLPDRPGHGRWRRLPLPGRRRQPRGLLAAAGAPGLRRAGAGAGEGGRALLGAAAERNGLQRLKVRQAAAGAEQGRARLRCRHSATCQVVADGLDAEVEMVTLDALTRGRPPCALKLDVEGSEEEVILGASETLGRRPKLFLELHAFELRQRGSSSGRVVDRLLADLKYTKVETLFPDACLESGQGVPKGNGSYPASRWDSAEAFLPPTTEAQPCACARRCWRELRPGEAAGCRCWDFGAGRCQLYRSCHPPAQPISETESFAGEWNLNLVLSAGSPASDKMVSRLAAGRACCVQGSPQL